MFFSSKNNHAATSRSMLLVALYEILKGIAALVFAGMVCFFGITIYCMKLKFLLNICII